ncbi:hypothetical protein HII31_11724, partial [Pseudocercospora fuligena]
MASDLSPESSSSVPHSALPEPTSSSTEKEETYFDIRHSSTPETLVTDDNLIVYTSALSPPIQDGLGPQNELAEFVPMPTPNVLTPDKEVIEPFATIEEKSPRPQPPPSPNIQIPALPLNLKTHKIAIACNWIPIIFSGGLLPIIFYFSLHYTTNLETRYILTIPLVLTAITTLFSLGSRIYALAKPGSKCRPLGTGSDAWNWKTLDFFTYNYLFGFIVVTILISVGIGIEDLRIVSLPLSVLILYICAEMIIAEIGIWCGCKAPFRISSIPRGAGLRPAVHVIVEDVVAVEGGMGRGWREIWASRYEVDEELKKFHKGYGLCLGCEWVVEMKGGLEVVLDG